MYMKKKWPLAFAAFILLGALIVYPQLPKFLSRQGEINPNYLSGDYNPSSTQAVFNNRSIANPPLTAHTSYDPKILGENNSTKRIEVDLTNQRLYAYEDDKKIYDFAVSTGKWGATPTGTFRIWTKLRYTLMTGGSQALGTYYYLPNVPYTMFFYNDEVPKYKGFGIHGTYWHNNFGHPMSHGCVNMRTEQVEALFYWANPDLKGANSIYASADNLGTEIVIYGTAPNE